MKIILSVATGSSAYSSMIIVVFLIEILHGNHEGSDNATSDVIITRMATVWLKTGTLLRAAASAAADDDDDAHVVHYDDDMSLRTVFLLQS